MKKEPTPYESATENVRESLCIWLNMINGRKSMMHRRNKCHEALKRESDIIKKKRRTCTINDFDQRLLAVAAGNMIYTEEIKKRYCTD